MSSNVCEWASDWALCKWKPMIESLMQKTTTITKKIIIKMYARMHVYTEKCNSVNWIKHEFIICCVKICKILLLISNCLIWTLNDVNKILPSYQLCYSFHFTIRNMSVHLNSFINFTHMVCGNFWTFLRFLDYKVNVKQFVD